MPDSFNGYDYLAHLRARWRLPALVVGVALVASLSICLLLPKKYTATVSLVIEPPAGSDPRVSTAVSPTYLESLRTYEHFASSDHLFAEAARRFGLRAGSSTPIETLKDDVLRVSIPRNTKVLEISAASTNPKQAHDLALYIANETVSLNRRTYQAGPDELIAKATKDLEEAALRLSRAEASYNSVRTASPSLDVLQDEVRQLGEMRMEITRMALATELSVADQEEREKFLASSRERPAGELSETSVRLRTLRSRARRLSEQAAELERQQASKRKVLAARAVDVGGAREAVSSAREAHEQAQKRLFDLQATAGYQGERLSIVDPGVVPERPSSPNVPLSLSVSAALGLIASLLYLTVEYSLYGGKRRVEAAREDHWMASKP